MSTPYSWNPHGALLRYSLFAILYSLFTIHYNPLSFVSFPLFDKKQP